MGWYESQHYAARATSAQAAQIVFTAEAFWRALATGHTPPDDKRVVEFHGPYPAVTESATDSGEAWHAETVKGFVLPWLYFGFEFRCPVSFAFLQDRVAEDVSWRLITPRPLVSKVGRPALSETYFSYWQSEYPGDAWPWVEAWGDQLAVDPGTPVVYRDGCEVLLRKSFPIEVAICLAAVCEVTGLSFLATPDPMVRLLQFNDGRKRLDRALAAMSQDADRRDHWRRAFEVSS